MPVTWYADEDGDGYGETTSTISACNAEPGWSAEGGDCDDAQADTFPGAPEVAYDGADQDCDGYDVTDADGDGWDSTTAGGDDCGDEDVEVHPEATEVCDGVDNDCDGEMDEGTVRLYRDGDADGFGDASAPWDTLCDTADGYASNADDCDDADPYAWPGNTEITADGADNDCDGWIDPAASSWTLADGVAKEVTTIVVRGRVDLGSAVTDPTTLTVEGGLGGSAPVSADGTFAVTVNQEATGVLRALDASGNVLALRVLPKSASLLPPGEVTLDHHETVYAVMFMTPGWTVTDPFVSGTLLAAMRAAADPALVDAAGAALEAQLAADPTALRSPPPEVATALEDIAGGLLEMAGAASFARATYSASSEMSYVYTSNGLFPGTGADADYATVDLVDLDPLAYTGTFTITNEGYRWLSVYLDPDDEETSLLATGDSEWLGLVPARSVEIPDATALAYAILRFSGDLFLTALINPDDADMVAIFQEHWNELATDVANPEEREFPVSDLEPFRTGRLMLAGPGFGDGAEPGSRAAPAELLTVFTQVAVPAVSVWLDVDDLLDPTAYTTLSSCESLLLVSSDYADDLDNLFWLIGTGANEQAFDALLSTLWSVLQEDDLWGCIGLRGLVSVDWMLEQLGTYASASWNPIVWYNLGADALSLVGTFVGLTITVADAPRGANYDVSIVDRDEDRAVDAALGGDDCDDTDTSIGPSVPETWYDGVDADCSGGSDDDADGDGDDALAYGGGDCDDADATRASTLAESCNGNDDDCDGTVDDGVIPTWYVDNDADGFGDPASGRTACTPWSGYVADATDCDDGDDGIYPGAVEVCGDAADDDCDGTADACAYSGTVSLSGADVVLYSETADEGLGLPVAAGDVNGDGLDDLVASAYTANTLEGVVYVVTSPLPVSVAATDADAILYGEGYPDLAGRGLALGDIDGNGMDDLLIGAEQEGTGGSYAGAVYVVLGPPAGGIDLGTADAFYVGEDSEDSAGGSLTTGDLDDDGLLDVVIGASTEDAAGAYAGAVYIMDGNTLGTVDLSRADAKLTAEAGSDNAGHAVATGDVNADGVTDLFVSAPDRIESYNEVGAVYLVLGPISGRSSLSGADAERWGEARFDDLGSSVAIADLDADGYGDVIAGAPGEDSAGSLAGAVYVELGPVSGNREWSSPDVKLTGRLAGDGAGSAVAAGDTNGDGIPDLLVGAWSDDASGTNAGAAYLFLGMPVSGDLGSASAIFTGESAGDAASYGLAVGDFDGDGLADPLVGAWYGDHAATDAGAAYVLYGGE